MALDPKHGELQMSERPVTTDALETLGTIHTREEHRDAIHLAVEPVTAGIRLFPGQHIGVLDGVATPTGKLLGIVDPFLTTPVEPGQKFWFVMYPRMVTSLRHVWAHPDFPDALSKTPQVLMESPKMSIVSPQGELLLEAERFIRALADRVGLSYKALMEAADNWVVYENYYIGGANMEGEWVPEEFWDHYEVLTGETIPDSSRGSFFSCSC